MLMLQRSKKQPKEPNPNLDIASFGLSMPNNATWKFWAYDDEESITSPYFCYLPDLSDNGFNFINCFIQQY